MSQKYHYPARVSLLLTVLLLFLVFGGRTLIAQEEEELGWFFTAELSTVSTGGNQEIFTLGLSGTLAYRWARSQLKLEGGSVRSESSLKTRTAVGTSPDDFVLVEEKVTETTAAASYARTRYDYDVSERFFVFGGADWLRNTFAGIDSRFLLAAGAGNTWWDAERVRFKTDYGVTYTFQSNVVDNPFINNSFPGVRLAYDFWWKLTGPAKFESQLIVDWNLDNTDDIRLDFSNALPIAISETLALKPALRLLWFNDPALTEVPLETPAGDSTGENVLVPLEKLDSFFTLALVVTI